MKLLQLFKKGRSKGKDIKPELMGLKGSLKHRRILPKSYLEDSDISLFI